ncbi:sensor histidine kinase [Brevibacillus borstelensis]|uniref:sensor histidine kinase n=1 Tax=Brevibacillus borstelensis TaxID=45462 RepID=UPI0030C0792D
MSQLLTEIRLMLYLLQWVLFLSFFSFYLQSSANHDSFYALLLGVIVVYAGVLWYALPRKSWFTLGVVDLGVALVFIVLTGKSNSPFMLYAYTTLLWLTAVLRLERFLLVAALFLLAYFVLQAWIPHDLPLPQPYLNHLRLLLDILLWTSLSYWVFTMIKQLKGAYAKCLQIYRFMRRMSEKEQNIYLTIESEKAVKRMFHAENAYLCLFEEREGEGNWRRDYFVQRLLDLGAEGWEHLTLLPLHDFTGREDTYACLPLRQDGRSLGCLLFVLSPKRQLSRYERLLLRMTAVVICQHVKQNRIRYEMARSLHREMRRKLAQDMHDGLAQQLFFLSAQLFQIKQTLPPEVQASSLEKLQQMEERIQWCHSEVREYITHLRDVRPTQRIAEAVQQLLGRITVGTGLTVDFVTRGRLGEEPLPILDAIYRLVEEASANVVKHAAASRLEVSVEASSLQITVRIKDDGIGFLPEKKTDLENSYGLLGMRERIRDVGGTLHIRSRPDEGTEIVAIVPKRGVEMYG